MNIPLKVLIIEDSEIDAKLLVAMLRRGGFEPEFERVGDAAGLSAALDRWKWDVVLSDHLLPGIDSIEALGMVRAIDPDVPFIIVSGVIGDDLAVAAMKAGAQDYLMKTNLSRLAVAVARELQDAEDRRARQAAERALMAQEEELRIARDVQRRLFPVDAPVWAGRDIAGASLPATATDGDYFDFFPDPGGGLCVVAGDVTGHGLGPALLMADVRAYLRALALVDRSLVDILTQVRRLLKVDLGSERFITLLFARFDADVRTLEYLNAGHPPAYVMAPDGRIKAEMVSTAPALGIDGPEIMPEPGRIDLEPGDLVLLLTDGVIEARSSAQEEFGEARAVEIVQRERARPAAEIVQALLHAVRQFVGNGSQQDDMTAVVVKT